MVATMIKPLSTPHGALGTVIPLLNNMVKRVSFNSTRCIRNNLKRLGGRRSVLMLSTPHGALGTRFFLNPSALPQAHLSTPHGALGTYKYAILGELSNYNLSTPHGALGTTHTQRTHARTHTAFNSTRCIRNFKDNPKMDR